jgi:hypothetical protein
MIKVQNLIVLFPTIVISLILFLSGNEGFAVEFSNYTNDKINIQLEYPTGWKIIEKESRFDSGPDVMIADYSLSKNINIVAPDTPSGFDFGTEELTDLTLTAVTRQYDKEYKTIESPSLTTIDDEEAGTFLITEQDKYDDYAVKYAKQAWIVPKDNKSYVFTFISSSSVFDDPENVEIRDHLINSIKFLDRDDTTQTKKPSSRFD